MIFITITLLCWGLWGIFDKKALEKSPSHNLIVTRYLLQVIQIPILACILNTISPDWHLSTSVILWSGLAAVGYAIASFSYLTAMSKAEASYVLTLTACYPIIGTILAIFFLKEELIPCRLIGVTIACIGMAIVSAPVVNKRKSANTKVRKTVGVYIALATLGWAICGIVDKKAVGTALPLEVYLSICIWSLVILPVTFWIYKKQGQHIDIKNGKAFLFCILSASCSAVGVWGYLSALSNYSASYVISITACYPVLMYCLAIIFLKEQFNRSRFTGMMLIILGSIVIQTVQCIRMPHMIGSKIAFDQSESLTSTDLIRDKKF